MTIHHVGPFAATLRLWAYGLGRRWADLVQHNE